jgi:integrase
VKNMSRAPNKDDIAAALPDVGKGEWRDPDTSNLIMRGNAGGGIWYLRHRVNGKRIRDKLGRWPELSVTGARKAAATLAEATAVKLAAGGDVLGDRRAKQIAREKRRGAVTLQHALTGDRGASYAETRLASLRSGGHAKSVLLRVFEPILSKSLADLEKAEVLACIDAKRATAPSAAEQAIRYGRPFWSWIAERGLGDNLLDGVKAKQTNKRDRKLTIMELGRVLVALDDMGDDTPALIIRTLIATAGRLNEVAEMRAVEVNGDVWTLPAARNKSGRVHLIPLNDEAQAAVSLGVGTGLVFPGRAGTPFSGWSRFKQRLDAASGVENWVFHDARRTFASICADRKVDPIVADRCLNHAASGTQSTVMRIYQQSEMLDQRRDALDIWAQAMAEARAMVRGGNVLELNA